MTVANDRISVREAKKLPRCKIVTLDWLNDSLNFAKKKQKEDNYLLASISTLEGKVKREAKRREKKILKREGRHITVFPMRIMAVFIENPCC